MTNCPVHHELHVGGLQIFHRNVVGRTSGPSRVDWNSKDALLYALSVGASGSSVSADDLRFTTENSRCVSQETLPTFGSVLAQATGLVDSIFPRSDYRRVQATQELYLFGPIPPSGSVLVESRIVSVLDKGSAGLVVTESVARDANSGVLLVVSNSGAFIKGIGGFGGSRGQRWVPTFPERLADHELIYSIRPEQALLFRLNGDRNPLHSDPVVALESGFRTPILHGLCTFGFIGRSVLAATCGGDVRRFGSLKLKFTAPVFPGDELVVLIWESEDGSGVLRAEASGGTIVGEGEWSANPA